MFTTDFESGAAGFTHSGTADEWQLGTPATAATTTANPIAAFTTCNSGVNCWKTDLTGTYNVSSNQDLLSPNINLAGLQPPVVVTWAQRYQMESANFDHMSVDYQQAGGATPVRLFDWLDATMTDAPGNPTVNIGASAGWGIFSRRADSLAGLNTELKFHLDSDNTVNFAGLAVDDVTVTACRALVADLSITKTDGVTTATPGGSVTYTITATNPAGADPVTGVTVADTFPAVLTCTWTCAGAGGGTCTAAGSGNINDTTVTLPAGSSVTYTATCTISAAATGTLSNTATVTGAGVTDQRGQQQRDRHRHAGAEADLVDHQDRRRDHGDAGRHGDLHDHGLQRRSEQRGRRHGRRHLPGLADLHLDLRGRRRRHLHGGRLRQHQRHVNLPVGRQRHLHGDCTISAAATGTLSNTATVTAPAGVTDPTPGNNSRDRYRHAGAEADLVDHQDRRRDDGDAGQPMTYTIVVSNAGPEAATGATVADTFPASSPAPGPASARAAAPARRPARGNINDTVNLPRAAPSPTRRPARSPRRPPAR